MKVIVGLGNPGALYRNTRHNVGFRVMDTLAQESGEGAWAPSCQSLVREVRWRGQKVLLAKPLTFMNLSGRAVRLLCAQHGLGLSDLFLVLDTLNLPLGRIRIREKGSAGGHNGMESVLRALGGRVDSIRWGGAGASI